MNILNQEKRLYMQSESEQKLLGKTIDKDLNFQSHTQCPL